MIRILLLISIAVALSICIIIPMASCRETPANGKGDYIESDFFRGNFTCAQNPIADKAIDLLFSMNPVQDAPNTEVRLIVPSGVEILSGDSQWIVSLEQDKETNFMTTMKVVESGEWRIQAYVEFVFANGIKVTRSYYVYLVTGENGGYICSNVSSGGLNQPPEHEE